MPEKLAAVSCQGGIELCDNRLNLLDDRENL
jgi:hypothetical protein